MMNRNRIANLRKANGMNQRELSEKLGVVQTTVSAWETGRNEPDNETIQKIADLFNVNFGYVAGYEPLKVNSQLAEQKYWENKLEEHIEHILKEDDDVRIYSETGMTRQEIERIEEKEESRDYVENGEGMYFEAYKFNKACEYMSAEQRKRALNGLKAFFPKAFQSSIDPD